MFYDARAVANLVLDRCEQIGRDVSNLSLQKIVYFCHVWTLVSLRRPLIKEDFEAWEHGPVMPYLYKEFKEFGGAPITRRATKLNLQTGEREEAYANFEPNLRSLLLDIIDTYSGLKPFQLVDLSHAPDGPWHRVWRHEKDINPGMRISNQAISDFYSSQQPTLMSMR